MRRIEDWLRQAEAALNNAKKNIQFKDYWVSCFRLIKQLNML